MEAVLRIFQKRLKIHFILKLPFVFFCCLVFSELKAQYLITDYEIAIAIEAEMMRRDEIDSRLINIGCIDGIVTLSGNVDNLLSRESAPEIAKAIRGVRAVINHIEILPPLIPDEQLRQEILIAFEENEILSRYYLEVEVFGGSVDLYGEVSSYHKNLLAENTIKRIPGIRGLLNFINVVYAQAPADDYIAEDIRYALYLDPVIDQRNFDIEVLNGNVSISGPVRTQTKIPLINRKAWVPGVKNVDVSGIRVDPLFPDRRIREFPESAFSDEEIFIAVSDVILMDSRLAYFSPIIYVADHTVTISGVVSNLLDRYFISENAFNVVGVWSVNNLVEVHPEKMATDSAIMENIKHAFVVDPFLGNYEILVNVLNGTVQITGSVDNYFEKQHATNVVEQITGVVEIINGLVVIKSKYSRHKAISPLESYYEIQWEKTDFQIFNDIKDRLFWNQSIHHDFVTVEVIGGHVTLRGMVDTWDQKWFVEQVAIEEGALTVINKIDVREGNPIE
jgi:osmotically-inducible protein OsmY